MANALGSLVVSLGLDAGEFTRGMTKAEFQSYKFAKNLERGIEAARIAAIGSMAAIGGAVLALDQQLQSIAGFQDLAEKIGDTAQEVASLKLASDVSGVSLESVASASVKLTTALSKLDEEGVGAGKALDAIGLNMADFKQLAPVAQIDAVSQALAGFEDGAGKTAVAVALFGKSGADLIPLFNDLADQGGRQITLTNAQITAADEYSKALARLTSEVRGLAAVTAADAAPAMTEMVQMLRDVKTYATEGAGGFSLLSAVLDVAKFAMQTIVLIGSDVAFVFKQTGIEIGGMAAQLVALAHLDIKGFHAISDAMKEDSARARKVLDTFQKSITATKPEQASYSNEGRVASKKQLAYSGAKPPKAGMDKLSEYDKYIERLDKQEQALKHLSFEEIALDDIRAGRLGKITQEQESELLWRARQQDSIKAVAKLTQETDDAIVAGIKAKRAAEAKQIEDGKRLTTSLFTPTEQLAAKEEELQKIRQSGAISDETYRRARMEAYDEYEKAMDKLNGKLKTEKSLAEELGLTFSSAFEDALVKGGQLSDILQGLEKDIARLLIRKQVTEPLAKAVSDFNVGGMVSNLFSGFFGGGTAPGTAGSAGPLSSFAGGGYTGDGARSGGLDGQGGYLAMLHPQESVVDHAKGQTMGGGTSINQSITIDARGADAGVTERIMQAMRQTKAETLAAVQAQANRGGSFARAVGRA